MNFKCSHRRHFRFGISDVRRPFTPKHSFFFATALKNSISIWLPFPTLTKIRIQISHRHQSPYFWQKKFLKSVQNQTQKKKSCQMTTNLKSDKNHTFILQSFKGMYTSSEILIDLSSEFPGESQQFTSVRSFRSSFSFQG